MDLSKLSDADLEAIKAGDMSKVSDEGLRALAGGGGDAPVADKPKKTRLGAVAPYPGVRVLTDAETGQGITSDEAGKAMIGTGVRGGAPAVGQVAGSMMGPAAPVAVPLLGGIGGALGEVGGAMVDGEMPRMGRILSAAAVGSIPGSPLVSGGRAMAGRMAMDAGINTAAKNIETLTDEGRFATAGENAMAATGGALAQPLAKVAGRAHMKAIGRAVRDQTVADMVAAGYKIPPSMAKKLDPSPINNVIEDIAGKAATVQEAAIWNQEITNNLIRKEVGLPSNAPITQKAILDRMDEVGQVYERVGTLSGRARIALEGWKKFGSEARLRHASASRTGDYEMRLKADKAEARRDAYERVLEREARAAGQPDLVQQLADAKVMYAKLYDVDKALNLGDGDVAAGVLGRAYNSGKKLTGNLELVARAQQAFPQIMRPAASVPASGVSRGDFYLTMAAGGIGASFGGPAGAAIGSGLALAAPGVARKSILSGPYQQMMLAPGGRPRYSLSESLLRQAALQNTR